MNTDPRRDDRLSVYVHGLTADPLTERYVRWWASHPRDAQPAMGESVPAGEQRAGPRPFEAAGS